MFIYLRLLTEGDEGIFNAQSVHVSWPKEIPDGGIVIKGMYGRSGIRYGIESYFIPEKNRQQIEQDLRNNSRQAKAQIKVDKYGNAALIRLLIEDRVYEY